MKVTIVRTPPTKLAKAKTQKTMLTSEKETVIFGAGYQVPPRFQQHSQSTTLAVSPDSFVATLECHAQQTMGVIPSYDIYVTGDFFVVSVTVGSQSFGSGGSYKTRDEAREASAQAACRALGCLRGDSSRTPTRQFSGNEIIQIRNRIKKLVDKRPNGLWCSRLPIEYKNQYQDDLPTNITELVDGWPEVVNVEGQGELKILLPVTSTGTSDITAPLRTCQQPHQDKNLSKLPWRRGPPLAQQQPEPTITTIASCHLPANGTTVEVYLTYVENPSLFYVHHVDSTIQELSQQLYNNAQEGHRLNRNELTPGQYVCAQAEDKIWYRAHILPFSPGNESQIEVFYIDFGNTELLTLNRLRKLPAALYKWRLQAVPCSLQDPHRYPTDATTTELNSYTNVPLKMNVINTTDGKCTVELCTQDGEKVIENPKVTEPESLELPQENEWDVIVSYVVSGNQVVLRLVDEKYSEKLTALEELISQTAVDSSYKPAVGDLCAANITSTTPDNELPWYRVQIKTIEGDLATCDNLDYGGTEVVECRQLRLLRPEEADLPYQAVAAYLTGLDGLEENTAVVQELMCLVHAKPHVAIVNSRDGTPSVTLYDTTTDNDVNMNATLLEVINVRDMHATLPKDNETVEGFVSYIHPDGTVHLQVQGPGLTKLQALLTNITDVYSSGDASYFVQHLHEGRLVMVLYSDGGWYRCIIRHILPNRQVLVLFVDYGNEDVVSCTCLRELENPALASLPYQALAVTLADLPPEGHTWTSNAVAELGNRTPPEDSLFIQTVTKGIGSTLPTIHLSYLINNSYFSINQDMLDPNIWTDAVSESTKDESSESECSLNITSESESEKSDLASASIQNVLPAGEGLPHHLLDTIDTTSGDTLAGDASFAMSGSGQVPIVTEKLAMLSVNAESGDGGTVKGLDVEGSMKGDCREEASVKGADRDKATHITASHPSSSSVSTRDVNSNMVVTYTAAEHNTSEHLAPQPVSSGDEVFVTWAADPSDFTFILFKQLQLVEDMMDEMAVFYYDGEGAVLKVEEPQVDGLYAGLYEDERWYRMRIRNVINQPLLGAGTMVSALLVDFGSFNLLPVTSLRQLSTEFCQLPFQGTRACLSGVVAKDDIWSEEAIARFEELTLERKLVVWVHQAPGSAQHMPVALNTETGEEVHTLLIAEGLAI